MIYTLTLNPAIDYVLRLPGALTPGQIHRAKESVCQFGGKGINVSNVLRELGQPSVALGFVAGFTGKALEDALAEMGQASNFIRLEEGMTRINVKIKAGEETELNGPGPVIPPEAMAKLYRQLDALQPGDALVLSGSLPLGLGADTYAAILSRLASRQVLTVLDSSGESLRLGLAHQPFLIKPNRQELEDLFGERLDSQEKLLEAARQLQRLGARNVLISLAGDGAILLEASGQVHQAACPQGSVVNSVGAGDSMVAGFLAGWLQTQNPVQALQLGIAAGSATAFSLGLATRQEILALLPQI